MDVRRLLPLAPWVAILIMGSSLVPGTDPNNASFYTWAPVSAGPVPVGTRALGYTCAADTTVVFLDSLGNQFSTTLTGNGFHSFSVEVPASFAVPGQNGCVFTAEK